MVQLEKLGRMSKGGISLFNTKRRRWHQFINRNTDKIGILAYRKVVNVILLYRLRQIDADRNV